jgi:O-antigen/teichoic acid export membrane protein
VTVASVSYLIKDFFVRHAYTTRKEIWALEINIAVAIGLAVLLIMHYQQSIEITATGALWIYALCHMVAAATGQFLSRLPFLAAKGNQVLSDAREAWDQGRWALMTTLMYSLRSQAYIFLTALAVGPAGVARLNAARLLVTPAVMLTPALGQVFMPRLSELRTSGSRKVVHGGMIFSTILLGVAFVYSGVLLLLFDYIVPFVLGPKYNSILGIVVGWSVVVCLLAIRNGGELILQALKGFRSLMVVNAISAIIAIVAVVVLMQFIGLYGAVYGTAIAEIFLVTSLWYIIDKE